MKSRTHIVMATAASVTYLYKPNTITLFFYRNSTCPQKLGFRFLDVLVQKFGLHYQMMLSKSDPDIRATISYSLISTYVPVTL